MSDSSIVSRFAGRPGLEALVHESDEAPCDDLGCFGWLRGIRDRATMLELRKKNGNILAVGYGWMEKVEFDPSVGITVHCGSQRFRIAGQNLNAEVRTAVRLFEGITRHRIPWVREASEAELLFVGNTMALVEKIEW